MQSAAAHRGRGRESPPGGGGAGRHRRHLSPPLRQAPPSPPVLPSRHGGRWCLVLLVLLKRRRYPPDPVHVPGDALGKSGRGQAADPPPPPLPVPQGNEACGQDPLGLPGVHVRQNEVLVASQPHRCRIDPVVGHEEAPHGGRGLPLAPVASPEQGRNLGAGQVLPEKGRGRVADLVEAIQQPLLGLPPVGQGEGEAQHRARDRGGALVAASFWSTSNYVVLCISRLSRARFTSPCIYSSYEPLPLL